MEEWLARKDQCGKEVVKGGSRYCRSTTTAWVWEAFAYKVFERYDNYYLRTAPFCKSRFVSGDGLVMNEESSSKTIRVRYYTTQSMPEGIRWQEPDIFMDNQFAETIKSDGPMGSILPTSNSTYKYRSLINSNELGIICFYDKLWFGNYWYSNGASEDWAMIWYEFHLRPRQISRTDLIMFLLKNQCNRPCYKATALEYPCLPEYVKDDLSKIRMPHRDEVTDDQVITLPGEKGKTVKGSLYKKEIGLRDDYTDPCIAVCVQSEPKPAKCQVINVPTIKNQIIMSWNAYYSNHVIEYRLAMEEKVSKPLSDALFEDIDAAKQIIDDALNTSNYEAIKTSYINLMKSNFLKYRTDAQEGAPLDDISKLPEKWTKPDSKESWILSKCICLQMYKWIYELITSALMAYAYTEDFNYEQDIENLGSPHQVIPFNLMLTRAVLNLRGRRKDNDFPYQSIYNYFYDYYKFINNFDVTIKAQEILPYKTAKAKCILQGLTDPTPETSKQNEPSNDPGQSSNSSFPRDSGFTDFGTEDTPMESSEEPNQQSTQQSNSSNAAGYSQPTGAASMP